MHFLPPFFPWEHATGQSSPTLRHTPSQTRLPHFHTLFPRVPWWGLPSPILLGFVAGRSTPGLLHISSRHVHCISYSLLHEYTTEFYSLVAMAETRRKGASSKQQGNILSADDLHNTHSQINDAPLTQERSTVLTLVWAFDSSSVSGM